MEHSEEAMNDQKILGDLIYKTLKDDKVTGGKRDRAYITDILSQAIIKAGYHKPQPYEVDHYTQYEDKPQPSSDVCPICMGNKKQYECPTCHGSGREPVAAAHFRQGYVELDPDQSLPPMPPYLDNLGQRVTRAAQKEMKEAGWVKSMLPLCPESYRMNKRLMTKDEIRHIQEVIDGNMTQDIEISKAAVLKATPLILREVGEKLYKRAYITGIVIEKDGKRTLSEHNYCCIPVEDIESLKQGKFPGGVTNAHSTSSG